MSITRNIFTPAPAGILPLAAPLLSAAAVDTPNVAGAGVIFARGNNNQFAVAPVKRAAVTARPARLAM